MPFLRVSATIHELMVSLLFLEFLLLLVFLLILVSMLLLASLVLLASLLWPVMFLACLRISP
jgi:hypothetical protein